jgi:hypothetical protein
MKGSYRYNYEQLVDDDDYQQLSPLAQSIFHTLKLKLGQYGIGVFYVSALEDIHRRASGEAIRAALVELEQVKPSGERGWIVRDRNVLWIVNGLKHDPSWVATNKNCRQGAVTFVRSLPKSPLVEAFLAHYGLSATARPTPFEGATEGLPTLPPTTETETESERETESEEISNTENPVHISTSLRVENSASKRLPAPPPAHAGGTATAIAPASTATQPSPALKSEAVRRFMLHFYPHLSERRDDVMRQLDLALTDLGVPLERTLRARAVDLQHLSDVCRDVLEDPPRLADKAIVFVLKKLNDSYLEVRSSRFKAAERRPSAPACSGAPVSISNLVAVVS